MLPIPGKSDTITLTLDNIRMSNLGGDNKLTTKLLTDKIIVKLTEAVTRQGKGILPESILNTTGAALENVMKTGQDLGKAATEEAEKIIDAGKDIGTEITEGIKGLLSPKREKEP